MLKTPMVRSTLVALVSSVTFSAHAVADATKRIEVPAGELVVALETLSRQAAVDLVFQPDQLKSFRTEGVNGTYSPQDAIRILLKGTPLQLRTDASSGAMVIAPPAAPKSVPLSAAEGTESASEQKRSFWSRLRLAQTDTPTPSQGAGRGGDRGQSSDSAQSQERIELEEIVVTGTLIKGSAPVGSALKVYSREDIEKSGAATIDQFARQIVENFASADSVSNSSSSAARFGSGSTTNNTFGGAAFDLRGIGPSSTLTLLNGNRLASGGFSGAMTDVSTIPLSAIERIEVMADGASAVYGADAVAGVVNIITRNDFAGAETGLSYGGASGGGGDQLSASQLLGTSWTTGNAFINYEHNNQDVLDVSQRDYLPNPGGRYSLIPESEMDSILFAVSQSVGQRGKLSGNAIYSDRQNEMRFHQQSIFNVTDTFQSSDIEQAGVSLGYEHAFGGDWVANVTGNYSRIQQAAVTQVENAASPDAISEIEADSDVLGGDLVFNGTLARLGSGEVKAAFGIGAREESFENIAVAIQSGSRFERPLPDLSRRVKSAYGELRVPVFGDSATDGGRMEVSAAVRYDDYSDVGSSENYRLGLNWSPVTGVRLRGTYGTSFKAPQLTDLGGEVTYYALPSFNPTVPGGSTNTLYITGGNPGLNPEDSKSFTAGFDLQLMKNLTIAATYFNIDFRDRVAAPPVTGNLFQDPGAIPFLTFNPALADVEAYFAIPGFLDFTGGGGPASIEVIFDSRLTNLASTRQSGVDFNVGYRLATLYGDFALSLAGARLLNNEYQTISSAPYIERLNTFAQPPKWRGRAGLAWARGEFQSSLSLSYVNSYKNGLGASPGVAGSDQTIDSWLTADAYVSYAPDVSAGLVRNLTIAVSITNITDERPPQVDIPRAILQPGATALPFDAANASPTGRFVLLRISKRW